MAGGWPCHGALDLGGSRLSSPPIRGASAVAAVLLVAALESVPAASADDLRARAKALSLLVDAVPKRR